MDSMNKSFSDSIPMFYAFANYEVYFKVTILIFALRNGGNLLMVYSIENLLNSYPINYNNH